MSLVAPPRIHLCQPVAAGHSRNVYAGHSRQGHLRVSDAGGSRRSYRNGRASAVAEGTPFPEGPPESSVGGVPGWHHPAHLLASSRGSLSVLRDFRPGLSSTSRGSGVTKLLFPFFPSMSLTVLALNLHARLASILALNLHVRLAARLGLPTRGYQRLRGRARGVRRSVAHGHSLRLVPEERERERVY